MQEPTTLPQPTKTVAVVSGKGGSGKTMLVATMARILDDLGFKTTVVDTDIGTGGLSYYLSVNYVQGIGSGISEMVLSGTLTNTDGSPSDRYIRELVSFKHARFISIGDHKKLLRFGKEDKFRTTIGECLQRLRTFSEGYLLLDCRGGVDEDSLAVCREADDIVLVAETDPASFQTTQYLVDVLSDKDLAHKIRGFIVNRVFDDPSVIIRQGTTSFRAAYLGAIPFDLRALRDFNIGTIPDKSTNFYRHAHGAVAKLFSDQHIKPPTGLWRFSDFKVTSVDDPDSIVGGMIVATSCLGILFAIFYEYFGNFPNRGFIPDSVAFSVVAAIIGVFGSMSFLRRSLGRAMRAYIGILQRIIENFGSVR